MKMIQRIHQPQGRIELPFQFPYTIFLCFYRGRASLSGLDNVQNRLRSHVSEDLFSSRDDFFSQTLLAYRYSFAIANIQIGSIL